MKDSSPLIIEHSYPTPAAKIWKSLTDKNQMKLWYFDLPEFKPEVGLEFQFYGGKDENNQYLHKCKITEVVTNKKITYSWLYDGYEGKSFVTFELFEEGNTTRLKLTHADLDTFPNNPDFAKERFNEGWTYITGTSLKEFLEKN